MMKDILIKNRDKAYDGIVSNENIDELNNELNIMKKELREFEENLLKKMDSKSSEYCYEIGKFLSLKLKKYQQFVYDRRRLWDMLRNDVNELDNNIPMLDKWDAYEYCYMLSQLDKEIVLKYDKTYWDHLFDCTTAREDKRIYEWLKKETRITTKQIWVEFIKGIKVYLKKKDTSFMPNDVLFKIYDEILGKTLILVDNINTNGKMSSKMRDEYFEKSQMVDSLDKKTLINIINSLR